MQFKQEITADLTSQKKVEDLIKERLKQQMLFYSASLLEYDNKHNQVAIGPEKKAILVNEIKTSIIIPATLESAILKNENKKNKFKGLLHIQITPHIVKHFTTTNKNPAAGEGIKWGIFDGKKLTPVNIEKFTYETNAKLEAYAIILASIENLKEKGSEVNEKRQQKITTQLLPALSALDPEYLRENSTKIITELTANLESKRTIFSRIKKDFTIPTASLKKIANNITDNFGEMNTRFIDNKIGYSALKDALKDSELTVLVKEFATQNKLNGADGPDINTILGKKYLNLIPTDNGEIKFEKPHIKGVTAEQWRELRKINPVGFDKIISRKNLSKPNELETRLETIKQTVNKYTKVEAGAVRQEEPVTAQKAEVKTPANPHPTVKIIRKSSVSSMSF